jgi:hypothetical protein
MFLPERVENRQCSLQDGPGSRFPLSGMHDGRTLATGWRRTDGPFPVNGKPDVRSCVEAVNVRVWILDLAADLGAGEA